MIPVRGLTRRRSLLLLLCAGVAAPSLAQQPQAQPPTPADDDVQTIIVVGYPESLRDVVPERSFDEQDIGGYGVSTVEDLLDELGAELGEDEDEPVLLVNGERIDDVDEIAGYPVEAIRRLEVLPRGTSSRVGGPPGRRVYSIVLRRQVRSATLTAATRMATDGEWTALRGEAILTRIQGPNRINLSLRVRDEDDLLESERGIVQTTTGRPFDILGNVVADPRQAGTEIDAALSALAGRPVAVAGVPAGANPTLAQFAARADDPNLTDLGDFRTLRPQTRSYDLTLSVGQRLAPWLSASFNARLNYNRNESLTGLPRGLFVLPVSNAFSPFSRDVGLAVLGGPEPLEQRYRSLRGNANLSLTANFNRWRATLNASHQESEDRYTTQRQDFAQLAGTIVLPDQRNPFAGGLADLLPFSDDRSRSRINGSNLQAILNGPALDLPAGPLLATLEARLARFELNSRSEFLGAITSRNFDRSERALRGALDIPLASRRNNFLSDLGELSANVDYSLVDFSKADTLHVYSYGLTWSPLEWVRLQGSVNHLRRLASLERLGDPVVVTPAVRTFDFLTGETVDVTWITGGNPGLLPERIRTDRFAVTLRPAPAINLLLNAEYLSTRNRNYISGLPPASAPIVIAFPDRFIRDAAGLLTVVDVRPVNFARFSEDRLRYGLGFNLPIGLARAGAVPTTADTPPPAESDDDEPAAPPAPTASGPRPRLQFSANHTIVLDNEILIRPSLPVVDLLDGGAIGIAGGRIRHLIDFNLGLSDRGLGVRVNGNWRGPSEVETRVGGVPSRLRFGSLLTVNLRAYADAQRLFPDSGWLRGTRFSLYVQNLVNERQRVTNSIGETPLQYQPGYRDPLGRTVEIEFRKLF